MVILSEIAGGFFDFCVVARGTPWWLDPVLNRGNHPLVLDGQETRAQTR